jgi:hypothetical protein
MKIFRHSGLARARNVAVAVLLSVVATGPVLAQGWTWPWESPKAAPPVPKEPVYRQPGQFPPGTQPPPGAPGAAPPPGTAYVPSNRAPICLQLEQRLAQEANRGTSSRDVLPKLEADIRTIERDYQQFQVRLERADCYEYFLFSKSLRRTRTCVDLATAADQARQRLADLTAQRQQILGTSGRSYQDEIIRELARNNCGSTYQREASRQNPFSSIWQDEDSGAGGGGQFGNLPFATYRTICVRLCDGYFFPVSFSTLPTYFERDEEICQSRCAAPVELFYHQNPGGSVEQAVSVKSRQVYSTMKTAFRYRREFVQGCSCKQAEYLPSVAGQPGDRRADAPQGAAAPAAPQPFSPRR